MDEVLSIDPNDILIGLGRYRKDLGDMPSLVDSIKTIGKNIVPVIVTKKEEGKYKLVAGERRTKACKEAGVKVSAIVVSIDDIEHRVYEILENLERKDFDWKEKALATTDLIEMLRAKYDKLPLRAAAKKTGLSIGAISTDLGLSEALKVDPDMFVRCKTRESALKVLKKHKLDENYTELALRKKKTDYGAKASNYVFSGSCLDLIDSLPDKSISALITDPPYGIDLKNIKKSSRNDESKRQSTYEDDVDDYFPMIETLIKKLERVMAKDSCFAFFCRTTNFTWAVKQFEAIGFAVDQLPAIWFRTGSPGQTNAPSTQFARSYEMFLYGFKGDYSLVRKGQGNVLPFPGISPSEKVHVVQKPLPLMEEIVSRMCLPGQMLLDPFAGSATTLVAGIKYGCKVVGFEKDPINYDMALVRIANFLSAKDAGLLDKI